MKYSLFISMLIIGFSALGQEKVRIRITQEGYGNQHGLKVSINDQKVKVNTEGEVIFDDSLKIDGPTRGHIIQKNGRYSVFWIEPGASTVTVNKRGFPTSVHVEGSESHRIYQSVRYTKSKEETKQAFATNPNHIAALHQLNKGYRSSGLSAEELQALYDLVDENNLSHLDDLRAYLAVANIPKVRIDSEVYDFEASDATGESYSTADYRGKYLLLDFAATGCGPCWQGYPDLITETSKYPNLQVFTYNEDESRETWQKIAKSQQIDLPWPVLWHSDDKKELFNIYDINGWPTFLLISPEGKVLDRWMGGKAHLTRTLAKFVK